MPESLLKSDFISGRQRLTAYSLAQPSPGLKPLTQGFGRQQRMLRAEDAPHLGAAAPGTTAPFQWAEGARFCLQLPETLQPVNSDLGKNSLSGRSATPREQVGFRPIALCPLGLAESRVAASPRTPARSGPPNPGKAILCRVCHVHLSRGCRHHDAGCRGGQRQALPEPRVSGVEKPSWRLGRVLPLQLLHACLHLPLTPAPGR